MAKVTLEKYKRNGGFAAAILKGGVASGAVMARGEAVRRKAASMYGAENYGLRLKRGSKRVRAVVYTADRYAMNSNRLHNTLAKAKGGR